MQGRSGDVAGPLHLNSTSVLRIRAAKTRIQANCARAEAICRRLTPQAAEPIRAAIAGVREAAEDVEQQLDRADRVEGWRVAAAVVFALMLGVVAALGCVEGPDGRRVLAPGARALVEHVLACGLPVASAAAAGEQPDYLEASRCHLELVGEQLGQRPAADPDRPRTPEKPAEGPAEPREGADRSAPPPPRAEPNAEHGRLVVRAAELERAGAPPAEVRRLAVEADALARELVHDAPQDPLTGEDEPAAVDESTEPEPELVHPAEGEVSP